MSLLQNGMAVRTDKVTPTRHHHNAWHRAGTQRTLLPFHFSLSFLNLYLCPRAYLSLFSIYPIPTKVDYSLFPYYILFFLISRPLLMLFPPPRVSYSISIGLYTTIQFKRYFHHEKFPTLSLVHESFFFDSCGISFVLLHHL